MRRSAFLLAVGLLAACKQITAPPPENPGGGTTDGPASASTRILVEITGFEFRGPNGASTISATVGDTIEFVNRDAAPHTATSTSTPAGAAAFDSGRLAQAQSFRVVVTQAGTWSFRCDFHPTMLGSIVASAGAGGGTNPPGGSQPPPGGTQPPPGGASGTVTVDIRNSTFIGPGGTSAITLSLGQSVEFVNSDDRAHTATSTGAPPAGGSAFDSGRLNSGGRFSFTPAAAGTWSFLCDFHPEMRGTLVVASGGSGPNPGPGDPPPPPGGNPPPTEPPLPGTDLVAIVITDAGFAGPGGVADVTIDLGQTIEWRNLSSNFHDLRSDEEPDDVERFESGELAPGERFRFTPARTGVWIYRCKLHDEERELRITVR